MKAVSNLVTYLGVACAVCVLLQSQNVAAEDTRTKRRFEFTYAGEITSLPENKAAHVWLPVAQSGHGQVVKIVRMKLPAGAVQGVEKQHGNRMVHFTVQGGATGKAPFEIVYEVTRQELTPKNPEPLEPQQRQNYLQANRLVPVDKNLVQSLRLTPPELQPAQQRVHMLYNAVASHMRYEKPAGGQWGRGDAVWACGSKYGNCTDFHSLFISMCREEKIPSLFVIGFPLPAKRGAGQVAGYHCWAKYASGNTWAPVDISEAAKNPRLKNYYFGNLTANRIAFSRGRDLKLVPPQQAAPLNFFIYPYVEVDGQPHLPFKKKFAFRDL